MRFCKSHLATSNCATEQYMLFTLEMYEYVDLQSLQKTKELLDLSVVAFDKSSRQGQ